LLNVVDEMVTAVGGAEVAQHLRVNARPEEGEVADMLVDLPLPLEGGGIQRHVPFHEHLGHLLQLPPPRAPKAEQSVPVGEIHQHVGHILGHARFIYPQLRPKGLPHQLIKEQAQRMMIGDPLAHRTALHSVRPGRRRPERHAPRWCRCPEEPGLYALNLPPTTLTSRVGAHPNDGRPFVSIIMAFRQNFPTLSSMPPPPSSPPAAAR